MAWASAESAVDGEFGKAFFDPALPSRWGRASILLMLSAVASVSFADHPAEEGCDLLLLRWAPFAIGSFWGGGSSSGSNVF